MTRKIWTAIVIGSLLAALVPSTALAGDRHAVRNRWAGVAIGAGSVVLGGLLLHALRGEAAVATAPGRASVPSAPGVAHMPPPAVVYAPPPVVQYRTWIPGYYEDRWVPSTERQRVWVEGHYQNGWWVPGHWEERVRHGGYWTRVWVEGYWR